MDPQNIIYGETALDKLEQWLRASGEPQDIDQVIERYLELLREQVVEEES
jgi:hypothetical protein